MNSLKKKVVWFCAWTVCGVATVRASTVMVEAESFSQKGGWVTDQQFMNTMGSPFLLAHGLGTPVADASTSVDIPSAGTYRVLVRTRNWAHRWSPDAEAPGRFQVKVNGLALSETMGAKGGEWAWHEAGRIRLEKGWTTLALHDLTGFDGRCDAIVLTSSWFFSPPGDMDELESFRRKSGVLTVRAEPVAVDVIVSGGGISGICTAISAARLGMSVALLQDRPVLGGNNSSEVRVHLGGRTNIGPYPKLGDVVNEIGPRAGGNAQPASQYEDERKMRAVLAEKNIRLYLNTSAVAVEKKDGRITAVVGRDTERGVETRFTAPLVVDCTGDGAVGMLAGAEYRYGREGRAETDEPQAQKKQDNITMGASVQWYSASAKAPVSFPDIPWTIPFNEKSCERVCAGEWTWETGMAYDQINDFERIRDYGMLVVYSNWSFLKNHSSIKRKYENLFLSWVAYVSGKRESRRLVGDVMLKEQDLLNRTVYPDATACTTWSIDLHKPDPANTVHFPGEEFKSCCTQKTIYPFPLPYRCFYSRNVENLFMAGRNISVTHVVLGTVRVMRTCGMMGEVVGMAASLCKKHDCTPRGIYENHLEELKELMTRGVGTGVPQAPQTYNMGGTLFKAEKPVSKKKK